MKSVLLVSILLLGPLAAQEQKKTEEPKPQVQRIFILKYADPTRVNQVLGVFGARTYVNPDLHALAVSASPEIMPALEDAIKRLDIPAAGIQDIELTAYYLIGGDAENTPGSTPPKELDSVITQLKNSFAFKTYRLLDMLEVRTRPGRSADASSNPGPVAPGSPSAVTQLHTGSLTLSADGSTVNVEGMKAGIRLPTSTGTAGQWTYIDLGLNANVDIKEGQKVVVGRLSVNKDQALFLVLTARVVN
jgi:hypothetical protein